MSVKQNLIDSNNTYIAAANALSVEDEIEKAKKSNAANKQADVDSINLGYESQIADTQAVYDKRIGDKKIEYDNAYQKNAVQKLINEKQIAEKNANLGLTDSGLNRTQQTAAQLSYANQKSKIDLDRQNALDELGLSLTNAITTLQNQKASDIRNAENQWDNLSSEQGTNAYNSKLNYYNNLIDSNNEAIAEIEKQERQIENEQWKVALQAQTALQKAAINANVKTEVNDTPQKIYWFRGKADEDGNYLYYNTETGKNEEIPAYMNPYNSQDNRIAYSAEYKDKNIGFFQLADGMPGYQPRGLVSEGGKFTKATDNNTVIKYDLYGNGKENTIWKSATDKYFIWDDINNRYLDLTEEIKTLFPNVK